MGILYPYGYNICIVSSWSHGAILKAHETESRHLLSYQLACLLISPLNLQTWNDCINASEHSALCLYFFHLSLLFPLVLADQADPCKFLACNEFSRCVINSWTNEAECLCDPGYSTVDGLPCQSTCTLQPNYCLNGGLCEIIPGHGVTCRYTQADKWKEAQTKWP